jgi:RNA polymerase sigma-70 factor, ECF subfamily
MEQPMGISSDLAGVGRIVVPAQAEMSVEELYVRFSGPVQSYLQRLCGSPELAEELAQETFIRACASLLSFRGDCSVATWLFRIARNVYLNSVRRRLPRRLETDELLALPDHGGYGDPDARFSAGEQRNLIAIVLSELPEKQRSILLLRDAEGLAYAEIADVLGISLSAVKVNLFRARNSFRAIYQGMQHGDLDDQL